MQFARPATSKDVAVRGVDTQRHVGQQFLCRRSRIWRLVTNLPSVPASGLVLTMNCMDSVGSSIFRGAMVRLIPDARCNPDAPDPRSR